MRDYRVDSRQTLLKHLIEQRRLHLTDLQDQAAVESWTKQFVKLLVSQESEGVLYSYQVQHN